MADASPHISGVAERYASSLFDLSVEENALPAVGADLDRVEAMLKESEDFRRFVASPVFTAEEQVGAISALVSKWGIGGVVGNFLKLVARNRRLFALPGMIRAFRLMAAAHRGEETAEVSTAHALSEAQQNELKTALKGVTGKDVTLNVTVDPSLLGGLVVKVGSRQIDTSLRTKLSTLKLALKEVG